MAEPFASLTIYRLRDDIEGRPPKDLEEFIDPEKKVAAHELKGRFDFDARLFVAPPDSRKPPWLDSLKVGFGVLEDIPNSLNNSAILILDVVQGRRHCHFAISFGFGRFLLGPGMIVRNYGLRVALNAVYPKHAGPGDLFERLRSVDAKTVAANTLRTRRQADRQTAFESFDVDTQRDLLTGLTGTPAEGRLWGSRITGSDALYLSRSVPFADLGDMCRQIERHSKRIPAEFGWVDNIFPVRDAAFIRKLKEYTVHLIAQQRAERLTLACPELVEWGSIARFAFSFEHGRSFDEPGIAEYIAALKRAGRLAGLTLPQLTTSQHLNVFDHDNTQIYHWPVFKCLGGEFEYQHKTYVLSEGDFFEVDKGYVRELDSSIEKLRELDLGLPASHPGEGEDEYNRRAAEAGGHSLLLDRKTVRMTSRTTPIEICDVLTTDRMLIHVKRDLSSSSLSHLFAQGLTSADLLLMSEEFRKAARRCIAKSAESETAKRRFAKLIPVDKGIAASSFTVVYGIIAAWKQRSLAEALPFFSKINLRRCARDLRRMGYRVACQRIPVTALASLPAGAGHGKKGPASETVVRAKGAAAGRR